MPYIARLLWVLAIGAVAAAPVPLVGQDLAELCRSLSKVTVGQWASFASSGGRLSASETRLAVVASERRGDSTLFWIEFAHTSTQNPAENGVVQMLVPGFGVDPSAIHGLIWKAGGQEAMRIPDEMLPLIAQRLSQTNSVFDMARRCAAAQPLGWEGTTVPAGTIRALHVKGAEGEAWLSPDVPFGFVKLTLAAGGETVLTGDGRDAKSSIAAPPGAGPPSSP